MSTLTKTARAFLPPVIFDAAARWRQGRRGQAEGLAYVPQGWQDAHRYRGWNAESVLEAYRATWPRLVREAQTSDPLNLIMGSQDIVLHNFLLCFAYSLALAAQGKSSLSMLDWGGAIGQYNLLAQAVLPGTAIDYHCKDVPLLAAYGQTLHPNAHFTSDETCFQRSYDFVLASGSLQYSEDWQKILTALAHATGARDRRTRQAHATGARDRGLSSADTYSNQ